LQSAPKRDTGILPVLGHGQDGHGTPMIGGHSNESII
jgi:hypothetical protein